MHNLLSVQHGAGVAAGSQSSLMDQSSGAGGANVLLRNREKSFVVYGFGAGGTVERPGRSQRDTQQVQVCCTRAHARTPVL